MRVRVVIWGAAVGLVLAAGAIPATAHTWTRVLGAGDPFPGLTEGLVVGDVALASRMADDGSLALVAAGPSGRVGPTVLYRFVPGEGFDVLAVLTSQRFGEIRANRRGDVLLLEQLADSEVTTPCDADPLYVSRRILRVFERDGGDRVVAEGFGSVSAVPGHFWSAGIEHCASFRCSRESPSLIDETGSVAFFGRAVPDECDQAGWSGVFAPNGGALESLAARLDDAAPGTGANFAGREFEWSQSALNAAGQIVFLADLDDGGSALYRWDPGSGLLLLARTEKPSPLAGGATFLEFQPPSIDARGLPAFFARDTETDEEPLAIGQSGPYSLWGPDGGSGIARLASGNEPAPGLEGAVFAPILSIWTLPALRPGLPVDVPPMNAVGELAAGLDVQLESSEVLGALFGPSDSERFTLRLLAGQAAPGIAGASFVSFEAIAIDDEREILFAATVSGDGIDGTNDTAWYKLYPDGALQLVLREGQLFEVAPGDWKPVARIRSPVFDADLETFAVRASGVWMSGAVFVTTVPEPAASVSSAGALLALWWLSSRRRARADDTPGSRRGLAE